MSWGLWGWDQHTAANDSPRVLWRGYHLPEGVFPRGYEGDGILDHLEGNHYDPDLSLGRHWTDDPEVAKASTLADQGVGTNVLVGVHWDGDGADPGRTNTAPPFPGMHWDHERETTLLPGTPVSTHSVLVHNPETDEWEERLGAGWRGDERYAAAVDRDVDEDLRKLAMAWQDWAPHIQQSYGGCGSGQCHDLEPYGDYVAKYHIDHGDGDPSYLRYHHDIGEEGHTPEVAIRQLYTNPNYRSDGAAEALIRRLHQDHPGFRIDPGLMTSKGRGFHDRMLTKEPTARGVVMSRRTAAQDHQEMVRRLRDLNHRYFLHRSTRAVPDRVLAEHPPLSVREEQERKSLLDYADGLRQRWDDMGPMSAEEQAAHLAFHGPHTRRDPDTLPERERANYYAELQHYGPQTRREHHHLAQMADWAEGYFGNMVNDATDALARHQDYMDKGHHPTGISSLEGLSDAHRPDLTGNWASEVLRNGGSKRLYARAKEYHQALSRVARGGPLHVDDTQPFENIYAFNHLENARNHLRVELQHGNRFHVPHTDDLSPIGEEAERHARSGLVNPRFAEGLEGRGTAAREAYKVNCQRCVLAAEARHRGHNVEARPNFKHETFGDQSFSDHGIASWFRNADGTVPKWNDVEDEYDPEEYRPAEYGRPTMRHDELPDGGYGLRLKHAPGPGHWDHMTRQIASWGPGARAAIVMSHPTMVGGGDHTRHIIHAVVDEKGRVNYIDPQTGNNDASHNRESIGYTLHDHNQPKRLWAAQRPLSDEDKVAEHNRAASPLRYMRLDDKTLSPETALHMVDRGTAPARAIMVPDTTTATDEDKSS